MGSCSINQGACPCNGEADDATPAKMSRFICHYMHQGHVHSAEIEATSIADARHRLRSLGTSGVVDCIIEPDHEV